MSNFSAMTTTLQRRLANHTLITSAVAQSFLNDAHEELLESHPWSRRFTEILILTVAQKSSGTFNVSNGSATAVASAGVSLASGDVGKYIRFGTDESLYVIGAVTGNDATLQDFEGNSATYAGTTNTAATYVMFKRWYALGSAIEEILAGGYKGEIGELTIDRLNEADWVRSSTGDPRYFVQGPRSSSDQIQIELWPRPTGTIAIPFHVRLGHTDLSGTQNPIVPSNVVVWRAAVLGANFLFTKTGDAKWLDSAGEFDKLFEKTFVRMAAMDEPKSGLPRYIQDRGRSHLGGTDFGLDHDTE